MSDFDLDIDLDVPDAVPETLRTAADRYREAEAEIDGDAGKVWHRFGKILERAAEACDRAIEREE